MKCNINLAEKFINILNLSILFTISHNIMYLITVPGSTFSVGPKANHMPNNILIPNSKPISIERFIKYLGRNSLSKIREW